MKQNTLLNALGCFIRGWALVVLWRWFIVSTFHPFSIDNNKSYGLDEVGSLIGWLFAPLIMLGVALIVKLWI